MKIIVLMENTSCHPECVAEHGLSIYIETPCHKALLDTGASPAFLDNAERLGVDLSQIDTLILSHGHYDHAGGIPAFTKLNPSARIYMQESAVCDYYHGDRYIGIDRQIALLPQICMRHGDFQIDEELSVFSQVTGRRFFSQSNFSLKKRVNGTDIQDDFSHEQYLVITQAEKRILLSGCAHNGILNILDHYRRLYGSMPQAVISGFHMMKKDAYTDEEITVIEKTADELNRLNIVYYTGHCTGQAAFALMKPILKEKLVALHGGMEITL